MTQEHRGGGPAQVVLAVDLANVMQVEKDRWECERPSESYKDKYDFTTFTHWLAFESGIKPRRIYEIMSGRQKHVSLVVADKILIALGRWDYLDTGQIEIIRNPAWTEKAYLSYLSKRVDLTAYPF